MPSLAPCLVILRAEFDAAYPNRSKASDGWIASRWHTARNPTSRHEPNFEGVVTALDVTHDPAGGPDVHAWARKHVRNPHPNLANIISNGEIAKRRTGFAWEPYRGSNRHDKHIHVGVGVGPDRDPRPPYDSSVSWGVAEEDNMLKQGDRGPKVSWLQARLTELEHADLRPYDGIFGPNTEAALKRFQVFAKVPDTGIYDADIDGIEMAVHLGKKRHGAQAPNGHSHTITVTLDE